MMVQIANTKQKWQSYYKRADENNVDCMSWKEARDCSEF